MLLLIGDLLVVDVVEPGHHIGFFVGHVVAETGFLELVVMVGFELVDGSDGRPGEGGCVGNGGIV